jgi:glucose/mannose transport system substrate-binding protein
MATDTESDIGTGTSARMELLHGWAGSGGEIDVMKSTFEEQYPNRSVDTTVNENVSLETKRRILTRNPPDVWAEWPGPSFEPYERVGVLGNATGVWENSDMERAFHDVAKNAVHLGGEYRGVPLNINRVNHLYYNIDLVEGAGVDPEAIGDPREFIEALAQVDDAVEADGLVMAFLQPFASEGLQLWESLYLGQHGPEAYRDLIEGSADRRRQEISEALDLLSRLFEYANDDAANLHIDHEGDRFANGEAAFRIQGMWGVLGHPEGYEYGTDWDHVPMPGTEGTYLINMDALAMPANPPHPDSAEAFLETMGSAQGIDRWCRSKQAIPPRSDVSADGYPRFVREQIEGFSRARTHLPSIAHGLAVEPEPLVELEVAFSEFTDARDVGAATDSLVSAFESG